MNHHSEKVECGTFFIEVQRNSESYQTLLKACSDPIVGETVRAETDTLARFVIGFKPEIETVDCGTVGCCSSLEGAVVGLGSSWLDRTDDQPPFEVLGGGIVELEEAPDLWQMLVEEHVISNVDGKPFVQEYLPTNDRYWGWEHSECLCVTLGSASR